MYTSRIKNRYQFHRKRRICQGDIFRNIELVAEDSVKTGEVTRGFFKYVIVLTQDCNLEKDFITREKFLNSFPSRTHIRNILICPAFDSEEFSRGTHIEGEQYDPLKTRELEKIEGNDEMKRYHYLKSGQLEYDFPNLIVDFNLFYTISRNTMYCYRKEHYVATLGELFREELSQRFANYLSRIGLPLVK